MAKHAGKPKMEPNPRRMAGLAEVTKTLDSKGLEVYNVAIPMYSLGLAS